MGRTISQTVGINLDRPTVEVGETKTLSPGTSAYVTSSDTTTGVSLDFGIPKGDKGPTPQFTLSPEGDLSVTYPDE